MGDRPPIILITLDTTRLDALSPYNGEPETTPALHEFAQTSTVFERAYATSPWTLPSHASMFTGLFPSRHGAGVSQARFPKEIPTLPTFLKAQGYTSGGFSGGPFTSSSYGLNRGFDFFEDPSDRFERADQLVKKAKRFLRREGRQPFFLFVNFFDPHAPYHPPLPYQKRFGLPEKQTALEALPRWRAAFGGYGLLVKKLLEMGLPEPPAVDYLKAAYASEIAFMDHHLGRFLDSLKKWDLFDKALIIIVSDHGEFLGEGGRFLHSYTLDPVLTHIPLMIKWPNQKQGWRNQALVSQVDLFATILSAAGTVAPPHDGRALTEKVTIEDRWILMEEHRIDPIHPLNHENHFLADHLYGIQTATARGIVWEGHNQCERIQNGRWVTAACGHAWEQDLAFIQSYLGPKPSDQKASPELDENERELLRSLGYIQ